MNLSSKLYLGLLLTAIGIISCQSQAKEHTLPYDEIYAYCLDGYVSPVVELLKNEHTLYQEDRDFRAHFLRRFGGNVDSTEIKDERLKELVSYFREYWHKSLLNKGQQYERELMGKVIPYLMQNYPKARETKIGPENIGTILSEYIHSEGMYTRDRVSKLDPYVDLVIWGEQKDSIYTIDLDGNEFDVKVIRLDDFLTKGWTEYATLGSHFSGGWTQDDGIYYVDESYDISSEEFKVSLIAHEARHFLDHQKYPDMPNAEMEYRGKLTELSLATESMYDLISFFIRNAVEESEVAHSAANYKLIHNLSQTIFKEDFVSDMNQWKSIDVNSINEVAAKLLNSEM
ncbi:hypothetical protein J0X14_11455 [Muricauda sp. CAU 1633]|uniref:hypothetical protein n=1 Tax=Allomuricauda sp. CAU 1633 TaxID=2816036 RepID=UPI001A8D97D1|nr:hypothetical protein [Muricauda sp. CAU 1633]MBO0322914.1 hypothetical protein [Muricauda sp. CAU 1633]